MSQRWKLGIQCSRAWRPGFELGTIARQRGEECTDISGHALTIVRDFASALPKLRILLHSDVLAAFQGDPAAHTVDQVLLYYPGIVAILHHRLEHHANIVPWQILAQEKGAKLRVIPVDSTGKIRLDEYQKLLNDRTKLLAITQVSNALGTITPVKQIVEMAHKVGARVLVDGGRKPCRTCA